MANKRNRAKKAIAPRIILVIIILAFISVIIAIICSFVFTPEKIVQTKIEAISKDFYENYLYDNLVKSDKISDQTSLEDIMQKYQKYGFGIVHLRQILAHNKDKKPSDVSYIINYCDENKTLIRFYPDPPFERTSYHIEYSYSCNF